MHLRLAYICKYIIDRCERTNNSTEDNLRNYLNNLKEKAKIACERGDDIEKYSKAKCDCGRKLYFSQLYCLDVPYIHEILNENYNEKIIIESFRANNIDFQSQNINKVLQEYEIETDLKFTKKKKINVNNDDCKTIPINYDYINASDTIEYIIKHTEQHLVTMLKKQPIDLAVFALRLHDKMTNEKDTSSLKEEDKEKFWALFQVRLWESIMKGKQKIII